MPKIKINLVLHFGPNKPFLGQNFDFWSFGVGPLLKLKIQQQSQRQLLLLAPPLVQRYYIKTSDSIGASLIQLFSTGWVPQIIVWWKWSFHPQGSLPILFYLMKYTKTSKINILAKKPDFLTQRCEKNN